MISRLRESIEKESKKTEAKEKGTVQELVQILFQSRDIIHLAHLRTNSYKIDKIVFYDSIIVI